MHIDDLLAERQPNSRTFEIRMGFPVVMIVASKIFGILSTAIPAPNRNSDV
jgi:hypothetical protein